MSFLLIVLLRVVAVSAVVDDVSCRVQKHDLPEQQVSTYMLGNLDGEEKEGESTAAQLRCLSLSLSLSALALRSTLSLCVGERACAELRLAAVFLSLCLSLWLDC